MLDHAENVKVCSSPVTSGPLAGVDRRADAQSRLIEAAVEELRPHLQRDGGDCQLVEIDGNSVFVRLTGACIGCQLASVTISGVQARLIRKLGIPVRVIPVK